MGPCVNWLFNLILGRLLGIREICMSSSIVDWGCQTSHFFKANVYVINPVIVGKCLDMTLDMSTKSKSQIQANV